MKISKIAIGILLLFISVNVFAIKKEIEPIVKIDFYNEGTEEVIDYEKYGTFENIDTNKYKYKPTDFKALKEASGEGIYPNIADVYKNPEYKKLKKEGKLDNDKWKYVNNIDFNLNYYKWATTQEDPGVRQYYIALALENAGYYARAIKAYYSIVVFFPRTVGITFWKTPWYVAPVAIEKIKYLTREHPEIGLKLVDAYVDVINRFDDDKHNDDFIVNPGKLVKAKAKDWKLKPANLKKIGVKKITGKGSVKLVEYNNKHYQLLVDDKPYIVRGICYSPNPVGTSPDNGTLNASRDWMFADYNENGVIDGPYEAWVDKNCNDKKDTEDIVVGDFKLMKEMGINTLRLYHYPDFNKDLLMDGYKNYGFRYMIGNFIGMYCTDSGAEWFEGTDYTNEEQCLRMLASVEKMVNEYKDEPYVLMWVLGNENNYGTVGKVGVAAGTGCNVRKDVAAYYKFVNRCAKRIKDCDKNIFKFIILNSVIWSRNNEYKWFNLGLTPKISDTQKTILDDTFIQKAKIFVFAEHFKYNMNELIDFKSKFNPIWKDKYIAFYMDTHVAQFLKNFFYIYS